MGIAERKEREKEEMRKLILNTATKMFIEEGYDKTSIRAIAEKIQYSPATIYLYFKDKDILFYEIQRQGFRLFLETFKMAEGQEPMEKFKHLGKAYMEFAHKNPGYYDLMFIMRAPMDALEACEEEWDEGAASYEYLRQSLRECVEAGYRLKMDLEVAALSCFALVHGLASLNIRGRLQMMPEPAREYLINAAADAMPGYIFHLD